MRNVDVDLLVAFKRGQADGEAIDPFEHLKAWDLTLAWKAGRSARLHKHYHSPALLKAAHRHQALLIEGLVVTTETVNGDWWRQ